MLFQRYLQGDELEVDISGWAHQPPNTEGLAFSLHPGDYFLGYLRKIQAVSQFYIPINWVMFACVQFILKDCGHMEGSVYVLVF